MGKKIRVAIDVPAYKYLNYLERAIDKDKQFKYQTVYQIGARFSGKTVAGTIAVIRAIISAWENKTSLVVYLFRMRHKDVKESIGGEITSGLRYYQVPFKTNWSQGLIKALTTDIFCFGCYTAEGTPISKIGLKGNYQYSHCVVVLEEAFVFDPKTYYALREAIRGVDKITGILRTNPGLASNGLIQKCFQTVPLREEVMVGGSGNIGEEVGKEVYHYMRWDVNVKLPQAQRSYLEEVRINNPQRARTVYYGLPGVHEGMVFASILNKITTEFAMKRWTEFTAGVDVGHVTSAMAGGLGALEPRALWKVAEYYHDNKSQRYMEAIDQARAILTFYQEQKDKFRFKELTCYVDCADPGFISLLNTEAQVRNQSWFTARACTKIKVEIRISWYTYVINKGTVGISRECRRTLEELQMIAYDEKAEDDKVKLVKQNDHTGDSDMYALTPFMKRYINYDSI